jgi:hypothetical protein
MRVRPFARRQVSRVECAESGGAPRQWHLKNEFH